VKFTLHFGEDRVNAILTVNEVALIRRNFTVSSPLQSLCTQDLPFGIQICVSLQRARMDDSQTHFFGCPLAEFKLGSQQLPRYEFPCFQIEKKSDCCPVRGPESIMKPKAFGTCPLRVQKLRYGCDVNLSLIIGCYNRDMAEGWGYFLETQFLTEVANRTKPITFYDSVTRLPLFIAPQGRSWQDWELETREHGWPSFRDQEVVWNNVRVLEGGTETVSVNGTHLGHNNPDQNGNRYCINLVSIAG